MFLIITEIYLFLFRTHVTLTGLCRATAAIEIKMWSQKTGSGIDASGRGSHRVYIRKI